MGLTGIPMGAYKRGTAGSMWKDLSVTSPASILQLILESILYTGPYQVIGKGDRGIVIYKRRKRRGKDMLKPGRTKEGRVEEELNIGAQKVYDSRFPVEI